MKALIEALEAMFSTPMGSAKEQYSPRVADSGSTQDTIEPGMVYARATSLSKVRIIVWGGNNQ